MRSLKDSPFSILELAPVRDDKSIQFSLHHALVLPALQPPFYWVIF
jgi:hypothetical protein